MSRKRFCEYMRFNRSTLYYKPKGEPEENLRMMEAMDRYYLEHPSAGVRTMTLMLGERGVHANEKRVRRLLRKMNVMAIYPRKSLSGGGCTDHVHPYLLRNLDVLRPNQVWNTDISYIHMEGGFMYLYAIIDAYSRYVVGWRLSNTLSASNALDLLKECVERHGAPEIVNSDQGSQYTTKAWEELLEGNGIRISMDGRGRPARTTSG